MWKRNDFDWEIKVKDWIFHFITITNDLIFLVLFVFVSRVVLFSFWNDKGITCANAYGVMNSHDQISPYSASPIQNLQLLEEEAISSNYFWFIYPRNPQTMSVASKSRAVGLRNSTRGENNYNLYPPHFFFF